MLTATAEETVTALRQTAKKSIDLLITQNITPATVIGLIERRLQDAHQCDAQQDLPNAFLKYQQAATYALSYRPFVSAN